MRALVLVAHADDETLGCGGTLQRLVAAGADVDMVVVGDGVVRARGKTQDNRKDFDSACETLGLVDGWSAFLDFPDQRFDSVDVAEIAGAVENLGLEPDLILSHTPVDLNRDHVIVSEVARIVSRRRPVSVLGCEIPTTGSWSGTAFPAQAYVELSHGQVRTKQTAFRMYGNELIDTTLTGIEVLARHRGLGIGMEFAEAFHVLRLAVPIPFGHGGAAAD